MLGYNEEVTNSVKRVLEEKGITANEEGRYGLPLSKESIERIREKYKYDGKDLKNKLVNSMWDMLYPPNNVDDV